jgi:hypothetical protein
VIYWFTLKFTLQETSSSTEYPYSLMASKEKHQASADGPSSKVKKSTASTDMVMAKILAPYPAGSITSHGQQSSMGRVRAVIAGRETRPMLRCAWFNQVDCTRKLNTVSQKHACKIDALLLEGGVVAPFRLQDAPPVSCELWGPSFSKHTTTSVHF